ncbi:MAG: hypothetical protein Q8N05_01410 [Bacteroidota bacterium]|nr:hypothetical protein [Bacteroidota bacterium]
MQKIQESKIKMSRSVSGILTSYEEVVTRTPGLNAAHDALNNLIGETERHNRGQLNNGTELTTQKNDARLVLETGAIHISAAMAAYATAPNDPTLKVLKDKYQVNDTEIKKKRDMQLFSYAYSLYDDATPYAANLEPFATAGEVAQLKDKADNFNALLPQRRTQVSKSSLSTQNLEEAIAQIDVLLNNTIDILMKPWETKEADFFKAYKNARVIVDSASRKPKIDAEPNVAP